MKNIDFLYNIYNFSHYDCQINEIKIDDIFDKYKKVNFLYKKKYELLEPYIKQVFQNYEKALQAGKKLLWILTIREGSEFFASHSSWRHTYSSW